MPVDTIEEYEKRDKRSKKVDTIKVETIEDYEKSDKRSKKKKPKLFERYADKGIECVHVKMIQDDLRGPINK